MEIDPKISSFIQEAQLFDEEKGETLISLREKVLEINPAAREEIKYGGLVFLVNTTLICGIFIRKKHISVEFSYGAGMLDPDNFLEGTGKYRKHLKLFSKDDIKSKNVEYYIKQSFSMP